MTELERELDRYRTLIATEIQWRLTRDLAAQAVANCRCRRGDTAHVKQAYVASTFDIHCSPTDAGYRERLRNGQYLLCFFIADELAPEMMRAFIDHFPQARAGRAVGDGELEANYAILAESLRRSGFDHHAFHAAFLKMCHAMSDEQSVDIATIPRQRFVTLRRDNIGVRPMLAYWDTQRAIQFGHYAQQLWRTSAITDLVVDAIWLCNDFFSVEKDLAEPGPDEPPVSLNGILIDARDSGDLAGAIDSAEAEYNKKTYDIEQVISRFTDIAADLNEPLLPFRARTAARVVNGNLVTNRLLVPVTYPGAAGRATKLRMIEY